jgi:hypothetical protein
MLSDVSSLHQLWPSQHHPASQVPCIRHSRHSRSGYNSSSKTGIRHVSVFAWIDMSPEARSMFESCYAFEIHPVSGSRSHSFQALFAPVIILRSKDGISSNDHIAEVKAGFHDLREAIKSGIPSTPTGRKSAYSRMSPFSQRSMDPAKETRHLHARANEI